MAGMAERETPPPERVSPRSDPQQERSRVRRQALLDAAEQILGEVGADGLRMREVARRAHLPIASVYHYFPSAGAIIRVLVERMLAELREVLSDGVARATAVGSDGIEGALLAVIDEAADFMESRPTLPGVWGAMRGAPELRALDVADSQHNAQILAPALCALMPRASAAEIEALALVLLESVSSVLQIGCQLPPNKRAQMRAMLKVFAACAAAGLKERYR
jgi:AcrR family transcriptional regulator